MFLSSVTMLNIFFNIIFINYPLSPMWSVSELYIITLLFISHSFYCLPLNHQPNPFTFRRKNIKNFFYWCVINKILFDYVKWTSYCAYITIFFLLLFDNVFGFVFISFSEGDIKNVLFHFFSFFPLFFSLLLSLRTKEVNSMFCCVCDE